MAFTEENIKAGTSVYMARYASYRSTDEIMLSTGYRKEQEVVGIF